FNFFSQRANRIATETKLLTDEFLELLLDTPGEPQPGRKSKRDDVERAVVEHVEPRQEDKARQG
ncbi:MAG TPA: hypothetical protein VGD80_10250, partial [Kofleriaceae bacterium]